MRIASLLTVSKHALFEGGGCTCPGGGGTCMEGVPAQVLPPPVNRMTDGCKNITLPQTWFAGCKNSGVISVSSVAKQ